MQQPPSMPPFSPAAGTPPVGVGHHAATPPAAPSPISSRPPEHQQQQQQHVDELGAGGGSASAGGVAGSFGEHEGMSAGGDDGERGGPSGNRWPRQETLALLKIRSEMDAAFREAALKGPLWEQVSRKLEAMGYKRSAKKCREKFENVDKYYKRTKDGRAGRGDGKAYRFFSELEALHGANSASNSSSPPVTSLAPTPVAMAPPVALLGSHGVAPPAMHAEPPPPPRVVAAVPQPAPPPSGGTTAAATMAAATGSDAMTPGDMSFSSGSDTEETGGGKRKRQGGDGGGGGGKMMRFFEGLMRQVMERQEEMQQRFIEAMERREQDRMIREEAWRRQEVARLAREQDALAQERAMAASRDAAVVSFIQRVTGQTIPMPSVVSVAPPVFFTAPPPLQPTPVASAAPAAPSSIIQVSPRPPHAMPKTMTPQPQPQPQPQSSNKQEKAEKEMIVVHGAPATEETAAGSGGALSPSPSRWPKAEVHALIELRTELEARYQDSSPKGPLWEDISAAMRRRGYNRNAKRCKEKWENINKYFKKVKESNKKRPEDSKTCPYYHQLEALYRTKAAAAATTTPPPPPPPPPPQAAAPGVTGGVLAAVPLSQQTPPLHGQHAAAGSNGNGNGCASSENGGSSGGMMQTTKATNGNGVVVAPNKQQEGMSMTKQAETPATEPRPQPVSMNDSYVNDDTVDSDSSMDDEDDFDDDDEEGTVGGNSSKMQYEIQFQRQQQQQSQSGVVVRQNASGGAATGPGPAAPTSGSNFLTMVHH